MRTFKLAVIATVGALMLTACGEEILVPTASVGDCLQSGELSSVETQLKPVACDEPHDAEVYALVTISDSGDFDLSTIIDESNAKCLDRFEGYVGIDYQDSELLIRAIHPTQITWDAGDRETICVAVAPEMDTGSFADSEY